MPEYLYTARDKNGAVKKGVLAFPNEHHLAENLREQGLVLTHFETKGGKKQALGTKRMAGFFGHVSLLEKVLFTRHLEIMIKSGISISRSLNILSQQTPNKTFKELILDLEGEVEKGRSFADSLAKYPKVFSDLYVNMIRTGEVSGNLEETLNQLATQMKKDYDLISKVKGAMMYPMVVLTLMIGVVILVIVYVLPRLTGVFKQMDVELPVTTRLLISLSEFIELYGIYVGIALIALVALMVLFIRSKYGRPQFHKLLLRLPIISVIIKKINLARFARTSSSLIKSGVSIINVLNIDEGVLGNIEYKKAIKQAAEEIKKGKELNVILAKNSHLFSPVVTQMIAIGEETGNLEAILVELAEYYESDVTNTMDNLSSILEPVMLVVLGIGAGVIAISVIAPIYSLVNQI